MAILSKTKSHSDVIDFFKELPFYNQPVERPVKRLKNIDPLLPEQMSVMSVIETDQAFKGYVMSCKVKTVEKNIQLDN